MTEQSKLEIKRIRGINPNTDYMIGIAGVTRIEQGSYNPEPYCERMFYQVYKGERLHSVVNDQAVAEIEFSYP